MRIGSRCYHYRVTEIRLRVRYAETDQMGVVYHANYLVWMEMGRVELCRSMGVRYRDMEQQDGVLLTVVEARCRYHAPARYDDEVVVKNDSAPIDFSADRVRISHRVR
jgi:acyl-CoA thioester hydrolase